MVKKKINNKTTVAWLAAGSMVLAGIFYNSWPLGYWLDPATAHQGMASDLEYVRHPYSWVFIVGDVLTGFIILMFAGFLYKKHQSIKSFWLPMLILGLVLFGFFTAIGAGEPNKCLSGSISLCVEINHKIMGLDGMETAVAAFGLLVGLVSTCLLARGLKLGRYLYLFDWAVFLAWFISGTVFILESLNSGNLHTTQQVLLLLTGVGLASIGANAYFALK